MSSPRSSDNMTGTAPLLSSVDDDRSRRALRRQSLLEASRFLRRASTRRMMREPSMLVRETAAEQLEERRSDWAYSKPVVILDIMWNFAFVVVAAAVLVLSWNERPALPLRWWILGYVLQCVLHVVCVYIECRQRRRRWHVMEGNISDRSSGSGARMPESQYVTLAQLSEQGTSSVAKHLESVNTMFSFIWWVIGFYWISTGAEALAQDSPQLYWLCITFLAFDVFFVVFCVALACIIGIAVCCCLPCIIAVLYAVAEQGGATKEDIEQLPRYRFQQNCNLEKHDGEIQGPCGGVMTECGTDSRAEHFLPSEDAECCICLCAYDDGAELRELPCGHHFHCICVDKWLYINATCPLCKYNILKTSNQSSEEV